MLAVPRVANRPEVALRRRVAVGELVHVQLAEYDCARSFETAYDFCIFGWDTVGKAGAAGRSASACGVEEVLQADRDTMQGPAPSALRDLSFRGFRVGQRLLACHRDESI